MNNYVDFPVKCPMSDLTETFRVHYVWHENRWFPLPPNICDNSNGCEICQQCVSRVIDRALNYDSPFFR